MLPFLSRDKFHRLTYIFMAKIILVNYNFCSKIFGNLSSVELNRMMMKGEEGGSLLRGCRSRYGFWVGLSHWNGICIRIEELHSLSGLGRPWRGRKKSWGRNPLDLPLELDGAPRHIVAFEERKVTVEEGQALDWIRYRSLLHPLWFVTWTGRTEYTRFGSGQKEQ